MKKLIFILSILFLVTSCTENSRAKNWGGSYTIHLPKGQKLIESTWKNSNLWYLTRPMRNDETPETFVFHEDSQYGIVEGEVIFIESK